MSELESLGRHAADLAQVERGGPVTADVFDDRHPGAAHVTRYELVPLLGGAGHDSEHQWPVRLGRLGRVCIPLSGVLGFAAAIL